MSINADPTIEFTSVPRLGTDDPLQGITQNVDPSSFVIAVFIKVENLWWPKPHFDAQSLSPISSDGSFNINIKTGDGDENATEIRAYVVPNNYEVRANWPKPDVPNNLGGYIFAVATR